MPVNSVQELLVEQLRDMYHAEKQGTKVLPRLAKAAQDEELRTALTQHLEETRAQVERLEQVFELLEVAKRGKRCEAMEGLVEESRSMLEEIEDKAVADVGLIAAVQKMEHYEIAAYGTMTELARALGHDEAADLLQQTLEEERDTDEKLNEIALNSVNQKAVGETSSDSDDEAAEDDDELDEADDEEIVGEIVEEEEEVAPAPAPARAPAAKGKAPAAGGRAKAGNKG